MKAFDRFEKFEVLQRNETKCNFENVSSINKYYQESRYIIHLNGLSY